MTEHNGKPHSVEDQIDAQVRLILGTVLRGLIANAPNVPPALLVCSIARVTGELISNGIGGDLSAVLMARKEVKAAFERAISSGKLNHPTAIHQ